MGKKGKLIQLIDECEKSTGKQFVLKLNNEKTSLAGLGSKSVLPLSAIVMHVYDGTPFIRGHINGVPYEIIPNTLSEPGTQFVGVDCQNNDNIKLYFDFGDGEKKITSKTVMGGDDIFIVFWETANIACLTFCTYDAVRDETIREILSADDEPMKRLLRAIASKFSDLLLTKVEKTDVTPYNIINDEEASDNESVFLRKESN